MGALQKNTASNYYLFGLGINGTLTYVQCVVRIRLSLYMLGLNFSIKNIFGKWNIVVDDTLLFGSAHLK